MTLQITRDAVAVGLLSQLTVSKATGRKGQVTGSHVLGQVVADIEIGARPPDPPVSVLSLHHTENNLFL